MAPGLVGEVASDLKVLVAKGLRAAGLPPGRPEDPAQLAVLSEAVLWRYDGLPKSSFPGLGSTPFLPPTV